MESNHEKLWHFQDITSGSSLFQTFVLRTPCFARFYGSAAVIWLDERRLLHVAAASHNYADMFQNDLCLNKSDSLLWNTTIIHSRMLSIYHMRRLEPWNENYRTIRFTAHSSSQSLQVFTTWESRIMEFTNPPSKPRRLHLTLAVRRSVY